jgi:hypothetical protein
MNTLISYIIQSILISGLLLGYYWIVLRNRKHHSFNRLYLLVVLAASLVLPLVRVGWSPFGGAEAAMVGHLVGGIGVSGGLRSVQAPGYGWLLLPAVVSLVLLVLLSTGVLRVYRLKARNRCLRMEGYDLIETGDPRAPFSFFRNLFWQEGCDRSNLDNEKIFAHELAHIRGRHSWDNLFTHGLVCLFWMNPFYWLIRRELTMVHEFIADGASIGEGDTASFARMLLQSHNEGRYLSPAHSFFHSPIKRRLMMISSPSSSRTIVRKVITLPVLLAVTIFFSCSKDAGSPVLAQKIKKINVFKIKLDHIDQMKLQKDQEDRQKIKVMGVTVMGQYHIKAMSPAATGPTVMEDKQQIEYLLTQPIGK